MDTRTLLNVKNLLVASNYHFLDGDAAFQMFAEDIKDYTDAEVMTGAKTFIRNPGNYPNYPGFLNAIRNEHYLRREYSYKPEDWNGAVRCPKCNDRGYIFHYWKKDLGDGKFLYTETIKICDCKTARERSPWAFMTAKERDDWAMDQNRKGKSPSRSVYDWENEEEFRRVVGEEITENQYNNEFGKTYLYRSRLPKPEKDEVAEMWKELADALG